MSQTRHASFQCRRGMPCDVRLTKNYKNTPINLIFSNLLPPIYLSLPFLFPSASLPPAGGGPPPCAAHGRASRRRAHAPRLLLQRVGEKWREGSRPMFVGRGLSLEASLFKILVSIITKTDKYLNLKLVPIFHLGH